MTTQIFFEEITQKLTIRENYANEETKCTIVWLFYYSSSNDFNCHTIVAVEETLTSGKYISLFLISNFYIYIKLKKLRDAPHIFWRNTQKLAIRENCASEENKCTLFVVILEVKTLIAIVYRPQEKNLQIILNAL